MKKTDKVADVLKDALPYLYKAYDANDLGDHEAVDGNLNMVQFAMKAAIEELCQQKIDTEEI